MELRRQEAKGLKSVPHAPRKSQVFSVRVVAGEKVKSQVRLYLVEGEMERAGGRQWKQLFGDALL